MNKLDIYQQSKTLNNYVNWLKSKNFSVNTIQTYKKVASKYQGQILNTTNIQKIFQNNLTKYEASYIVYEKTVLTSFTKFQKLNINWEKIVQILPRVQKKFFATINEQEFEKLKQTKTEISEKAYQRNNLILDFLFYVGLRISELVNIKHCDWNSEQRLLKVLGKGNKIRHVFLPKWLSQLFKPYSDSYLFPSQRATERGNSNQPLPAEYIRQIIRARTEKAEINKKITPHSFRRSFATLLNRRECNLTTIQKLLGHSKLETTIGYIHDDYDILYNDYSKLWKNNPNFNTYETN